MVVSFGWDAVVGRDGDRGRRVSAGVYECVIVNRQRLINPFNPQRSSLESEVQKSELSFPFLSYWLGRNRNFKIFHARCNSSGGSNITLKVQSMASTRDFH